MTIPPDAIALRKYMRHGMVLLSPLLVSIKRTEHVGDFGKLGVVAVLHTSSLRTEVQLQRSDCHN